MAEAEFTQIKTSLRESPKPRQHRSCGEAEALFLTQFLGRAAIQKEMASKGVKGVSISTAPFPSYLGKDDSSAKKRRERTVQFSSADSVDGSRSNGVTYASNFKGDGGKEGKINKPASNAKSSKAKEPSLELIIEKELPKNTKCLMDCEAAEILEAIQEHMVVLSSDRTIKIPISFDKGLTYAKRGSVYPNPKTARQILEPLKKYGISDTEICLIGNIQVESVDEVFALVRSLEGKKLKLTEALRNVVDELAKLKSSG